MYNKDFYLKPEYVAHARQIDYTLLHSEMTEDERFFVNGLIRESKPKRLLEVGVAGGGTVNLLNAISDMPDAKLVSIDKATQYYHIPSLPAGTDALSLFGKPDNWTLILGKDPSGVLPQLGEKFDFAIIDTKHVYPIEVLNLCCVIPYLNDDAIVVFHDTALFYRSENIVCQGSRILASILTGHKLQPAKSQYYISDTEPVCNITAVKITPQLREHMDNLFYALALPWVFYPFEDIARIRSCLRINYNDDMMELFDEADRRNFAHTFTRKKSFSLDLVKRSLVALQGKDVVFYGAGNMMQYFLRAYELCEMKFNAVIWDKSANKIGQISGHKVQLPDFEAKGSGKTVVITMLDKYICGYIKSLFIELGYDVISGVPELLARYSDVDLDNKHYPLEYTEEEKALVDYVSDNALTMVSRERLFDTLSACKYVVENNIPGDFVECGVWRGGNALLAASVLKMLGSEKKVWLFDTFNGFADIQRTKEDEGGVYVEGHSELVQMFYYSDVSGNSLEDVQRNFKNAGLLNDNVIFCKGDVMQTLKEAKTPDKISVLRLDTDQYESTRLELETLYPRIPIGGVLIIDDYGGEPGARIATDEYFMNVPKPFFHYTDATGRTCIKINP